MKESKNMILNKSETYWKKLNAYNTANEINQQPKVWQKVINQITTNRKTYLNFIKKLVAKKTKFVFSGAGTSEFVGNALCPYLRYKGFNCESIGTTDIVSNPLNYLEPKQSTCLISFARSGNSPESVATINVGKEILKDNLSQIVITCNKDGKLATSPTDTNELKIILPPETNDLGFAMTSSFTSMLISALLVFSKNEKDFNETVTQIQAQIGNVEQMIKTKMNEIQKIAEQKVARTVILGSGSLKGFSQEGHLKCLELNGGVVPTFFNSPMGFRHGPKSIVNKETEIIFFLPVDKYSRNYTLDLINEIKNDNIAQNLVYLDHLPNQDLDGKNHYLIANAANNDIFVGLTYIVFLQIYALLKSINLKNSPDTPSKSGQVNRIVKGVSIHQFKMKE